MREQFPTNKQSGDNLTVGHINGLSRVGNRFGRARPGSNQAGYHGDSTFATTPLPPFTQMIMIIVSVEGGGLYTGRPRYYSADASGWQTDTDSVAWDIDGSDLGVTYAANDKVVCYWDEQRGAFIPICCT